MSLVQAYLSWWVTAIKPKRQGWERERGKSRQTRDAFYRLLSITYICIVLLWSNISTSDAEHMYSLQRTDNHLQQKTVFAIPHFVKNTIGARLARPSCSHSVLPADQPGLQSNSSHYSLLNDWTNQQQGEGAWSSRQSNQKHFIWKKTE